jgi:predicted alpha/beta superfamily hydrolase
MLLVVAGCAKEPETASASTEFTALYSAPTSVMIFSEAVQDSFRIFSATPSLYPEDSVTYPLILLLDANAYFDPVLAEFKLGTLTQGYPNSVLVGIGYKDFLTLDSLRDRDYTFPVAPAKDSFAISGGGERFREFIDTELLPQLTNKFSIDGSNITLVGHSLGGYFVLHHFIESLSQGKHTITNYVAASPSLVYADFILPDRLKKLNKPSHQEIKLYMSMGTLEYDPEPAPNHFLIFKKEIESFSDSTKIKVRVDEYSNFNHMDAAMPGFMKGLGFTLVEN